MENKSINNFLKYYIKFFIFIVIVFINYLFYNNYAKSYKNGKYIKICLCSPGKQENKYIKEFVTHYKNYGVDKIYLYDNNNIDGEHFEEIINDYIKSGFVDIINFRGKTRALLSMMNDCYKNNFRKYNWLIFFELDEFIYLKKNNLKTYLNNKNFNKCETINLNWCLHTDNNLIYYENKTLKERFPITEKKTRKYKSVKSILKGGIPNILINNVHILNKKLKNCNGFGQPLILNGSGTYNVDFTNYYIDHYSSKSTEEFVNKMNKGDVLHDYDNIFERIKIYFALNKITNEKIDYFYKHLQLPNETRIKNDLINKLNNYFKISLKYS